MKYINQRSCNIWLEVYVIYLRNTYNERQLWCVEVIFLWNFWRRMQKFIVNNNHNKQILSSLHRLIEVIFRHILKYGVSILTSFHPQVWESTNYEIGRNKKYLELTRAFYRIYEALSITLDFSTL